MFAMEYAAFGDLTSMVGEPASGKYTNEYLLLTIHHNASTWHLCSIFGCCIGIGEACAKKVAKQIGSALDWIHLKNLCHLDVRLDNILVFKSDFSVVKLCDFGSVRTQVKSQ